MDWGFLWLGQVRQNRKEGRWLEKSIRVGQGTEKTSVGSSQLKDQEV